MSKTVGLFGQMNWPPVTENGKVYTKPFLEACGMIVHFFDALGTLFAPVKHDVQGNINKLFSKYSSNPEQYQTIHDMIEAELNSKENVAIESLLWLKRGLHFTCLLLLSIIEDHEKEVTFDSLATNYEYAYEISLKNHHNWIVQKFFSVCIKSRICPKRGDVIKSLGSDDDEVCQDSISKLKEFVDGLSVNLKSIFDLYVLNGLDNCRDIR